MHIRQVIREAVGTLLKGASITGARVFENRLYPVEANDLPCLLVMTEGDRSQDLTVTPNPIQERNVRIVVKAIVKSSLDLDDKMDDLCAQVEIAMANASFSFNSYKRYLGTENRESAVGNQPVGEASMVYEFTVHTVENDPTTIN